MPLPRFLFAAALLAAPAVAAPAPAPRAETIIPAFAHALPNVPGKSLIAVEVGYAPGAASPAHHHAASAFIFAYVLSGEIRSQVGNEPARIYKAGESFYENPGSDHRVSANASTTKPARLLAVFVVDSADKALTVPDAH